jgi:hypothetical protein
MCANGLFCIAGIAILCIILRNRELKAQPTMEDGVILWEE